MCREFDPVSVRLSAGFDVTSERVLDQFVQSRRKLRDDANSPRFIGTVRTVGYKFLPPVEKLDRAPASA